MKLHLLSGDIHLIDLPARMPFKYGIATMTQAPHAFVRMNVEIDGKATTGIAADLLPPKWFTKDPQRDVRDEELEMLTVIEHAVQIAVGMRGGSAFEIWRTLYDAQHHWGKLHGLPPLLVNFGTTLVERAVIEAVCRAVRRPFAEVLRANALGIDLGSLHAGLKGLTPAELLPEKPPSQIIARHTVGLSDPLTAEEIPESERLHDGLPQALDECIRAYGLRHFKLKVSGNVQGDIERLGRIADVVTALAPADFAFTLDGNEQFKSLETFREFWEGVQRHDRLKRFFAHLLFVEQPLHRAVVLDAAQVGALRSWDERPLLIIDESDGELDSLPRALELGYVGTSHKNCKGVVRGVASACLLAQRRLSTSDLPCIMSGEDLANVGPVALLQDLAVAAAIGVTSVERNGHHYFAGLSQFPAVVQRQVLAVHGDLYHTAAAGWPSLTISDGRVALGSVQAAPLGVGFEVGVEAFTPSEKWRAAGR